MELLIIASLLFLSYVLIRASLSAFGMGNPKKLPPGPKRLPIIGNLHLLGGDQPQQTLAKLAEIHGPIMSLKLGQVTTVVISSRAAAKEVLQKQDGSFAGRSPPDAFQAYNHAKNSIAWLPASSEQWRNLRRILSSNLFNNSSIETNHDLRRQKVEELVAYCQKASLTSDYVDIGRAAFRTSLNLLSNTIFSKDLTAPYTDSGSEMKDAITNSMVEGAKPNLVDFFPVLKKIDPQGIRKRMGHHLQILLGAFEELIEERLQVGRFKHNDVLDVCLKLSQDNPKELSHAHIKSLVMDVFGAGTDTTSTTIEFAMAEVLRNPHTLTKAKEELEKVIGKGKLVREEDAFKLPYLSCIAKETLRLHPPAPFLVPRGVEKEVQINGYTIPKGTRVLVNAWAIGRDPAVWDDPYEFKPERFMNRRIDFRGQDFELIPFGAGRRICPGLSLAIRMVPMMLGSLLNNFDWSLGPNIHHTTLDMTEKFGITLCKAKPLCAIPIPLN
ncbi:7-ethoxycoumarin O-deethylase-like [Bidens hawaiensis]|uniref:7-ethoxycoumarin O-deethylase-like n=1 Tax=Bidens hawaiensis TaxID=980011 RepID=UPI00404A81E3